MRKDLNSGSEDFLLPQGRLLQLAEDVTADGKVLLFAQRAESGAFDLWTMSPSGSPGPAPLVNSPADELGGRFSPDGRYVAFMSNESGRFEVYIARSPRRPLAPDIHRRRIA
jgi:Tol biopolymer transport system component